MGYIKEINIKNRTYYLLNNNKEVLKKYTELWDGIKNSIEKIGNKPCEYGKDFMKIKFNSDDLYGWLLLF